MTFDSIDFSHECKNCFVVTDATITVLLPFMTDRWNTLIVMQNTNDHGEAAYSAIDITQYLSPVNKTCHLSRQI